MNIIINNVPNCKETVINNLRLNYWSFIIHIRKAVIERFDRNVFPFTYVGIYFFTPITISIWRRRDKWCGILFTCRTDRTVRVKLIKPKGILTGNGTNLVGPNESYENASVLVLRWKYRMNFPQRALSGSSIVQILLIWEAYGKNGAFHKKWMKFYWPICLI